MTQAIVNQSAKQPKRRKRIRKLARESNSLSLMLRYQAHAERQYRRAVEEFERLKKLRPELPNEPISQQPFPSETEQSEPVTTPPDPQSPSGGAGALPANCLGSAGDLVAGGCGAGAFACQARPPIPGIPTLTTATAVL